MLFNHSSLSLFPSVFPPVRKNFCLILPHSFSLIKQILSFSSILQICMVGSVRTVWSCFTPHSLWNGVITAVKSISFWELGVGISEPFRVRRGVSLVLNRSIILLIDWISWLFGGLTSTWLGGCLQNRWGLSHVLLCFVRNVLALPG